MKSSCALTVFAATLLLGSPMMHAADYSWQTASGDWSVASNWGGMSPAGLIAPGVSDTCYIANGGTATIGPSGASVSLLSVGGTTGIGCVSLAASGFLTVQLQEYVGDSGPGVLAQSGGTNSLSNFGLTVGNALNASGTYSLSGGWLTSNAFDFGPESIGGKGVGTFLQSGGTNSIGQYSALSIGGGTTSTGIYNLSGGQLISAAGEAVGGYGTGTLNQTGGTNSLSSSLFLEVGANQGSIGYYNLSNGLLSGGQYIGWSGTGTFTQSGGTNNGSPGIGFSAGSSGMYNLDGGLLSAVGGVVVGNSGAGVMSQSGGTNSIGSGGRLILGYAIGSTGSYNLNGGMLVVGSVVAVGSGAGSFNFTGGTLRAGTATNISAPISLGPGGSGAVFDTGGNSISISGALIGPGGFTKAGSGTMTLTTSNTFSGNALVSAGTLTLANSLALQLSTFDTSGSGFLSFGGLTAGTLGGLTGGGTLKLNNSNSAAVALSVGNNSDATTFSGTITGSGRLTKVGGGVLIFSGSSVYSGPTAINQGELIINGSLASPVTINSGGVLGGSGSVTSVTVNAGGHLAPGNSPGKLTLSGSLSLLAGAVMDFELATPLTSDKILVPTGVLALSGQQFSDFNFTPLANFGPGTYTLINSGSISGDLGSSKNGTIDGLPASLAVQGKDLVLNVVPEPSTLALLIIASGFCWLPRRKRRITAVHCPAAT
jgi:autotransporter-associated beta strand protein